MTSTSALVGGRGCKLLLKIPLVQAINYKRFNQLSGMLKCRCRESLLAAVVVVVVGKETAVILISALIVIL